MMNIGLKSQLLTLESQIIQHENQRKNFNIMGQNDFLSLLTGAKSMYIMLEVDRNNLIQDTLNILYQQKNLKLPLKVIRISLIICSKHRPGAASWDKKSESPSISVAPCSDLMVWGCLRTTALQLSGISANRTPRLAFALARTAVRWRSEIEIAN